MKIMKKIVQVRRKIKININNKVCFIMVILVILCESLYGWIDVC